MQVDLDDSVNYGLIMSYQNTKRIFNQQNQRDCSGKAKVIDWLKDDLTALHKLFDHANPLKRLV